MKRLDRLPPALRVEGALALGAVVTIVAPYALAFSTPMLVPRWWTPIAGMGVLLLVALWLFLVAHALVDAWRLAYHRPAVQLDDPRTVVQGVFRVVETLGVVVPPFLVFYFGRQFGGSPEPVPAPAGVGALFVVVGAMVALALVVVLHVGWEVVDTRLSGPS